MREDGEGVEDAPRKKGRLPCAIGCLGAVVLACGGLAAGVALQHSIRSRLATYDVRLTLGFEDADGDLDAAAKVLRARLRAHGILNRVTRSEDRLRVSLLAGDVGLAKRYLDRAELRMFLVVGPGDMGAAERENRLQALKEEGAGAEIDGYLAYPWFPGASGASPSGWELLEVEDGITGQDFKRFGRGIDSMGRACLEFEMTSAGSQKLFQLTSAGSGQQLAVVFDGQVRTAPLIRAALQRRGLIESGGSWSEQELRILLVLLNSGPMPEGLRVVSEERLGE